MSGAQAAPRVTVAIPCYNSAATLARAIGSAAGQTLRDLEILVADDGSTDGSADLADAMALGLSRLGRQLMKDLAQDPRIYPVTVQPRTMRAAGPILPFEDVIAGRLPPYATYGELGLAAYNTRGEFVRLAVYASCIPFE